MTDHLLIFINHFIGKLEKIILRLIFHWRQRKIHQQLDRQVSRDLDFILAWLDRKIHEN